MQTPSLRGGEFLLREVEPSQVFIPEDFGSEETMLAQAAEQFVRGEVQPRNDAIEKQKRG
jgi:hypothetical protein